MSRWLTGKTTAAASAPGAAWRSWPQCANWPVAVAAALTLAACASYQPAPLDPSASAQEFSARRLDAPDVRERIGALLPPAPPAPSTAAWDRAQLLAAALVLNPKIGVARAQAAAALAHERSAAQRPNPELTLQSEYARHDPHPWLYGLGVDLLLAGSQRRSLETDQARLETSGARWELMGQAWAVRSALIAALSDREYTRRRAQLLDDLLDDQQHLIELARRRIAGGEAGADELLVPTQARLDLEQQRAQAHADAIAAQSALAAALGVAPAALDVLAVDWPDWGAPPRPADAALAAAREQALRARSDLAAAIDAYAAAEDKLHLAVLQQYPQLHLAPGYYWDHGVAKFPLNLGFELPLFHHNEGAIGEANAGRDLAARRMLAVQADIIGTIDAAERAEAGAAASVAAGERAFEAAHAQRRNAAAALRLGAIAAGEDLAAQILERRAQLEALQLRAQWQAARNKLEDALHAPLSGPELQLAQPLPVAISGASR